MKYYLFALVNLVSISLFSQDEVGTVLLSGNFNYNSYNSTTDYFGLEQVKETESTFLFNPKLGFYVHKHLILGFGGGIQNRKYDFQSDFNNESSQEEYVVRFINVFTSFQSSISERLKFNFNIDVRRGWGESEYKYNGLQDKGSIKETDIILQPGLLYFLSSKFGLSVNYGALNFYNGTEIIKVENNLNSQEIENDYQSTGLNFGLDSFEFGIVFIFPARSKK